MTDQPKFIVKPLENEDRAAFQCAEEALDRYFHERASRDMANRLSAVFIVVPKNNRKTIVGFFTLSSQQTACDILPEELRKKTGRYKAVGVTLLGRMAVDQEFQNQKLGRFVLFAVLYEAWRSTKHVSSFAVVVDAKTEKVVPFYEKYGFRRPEGNRLVLPMKNHRRVDRRRSSRRDRNGSSTTTTINAIMIDTLSMMTKSDHRHCSQHQP